MVVMKADWMVSVMAVSRVESTAVLMVVMMAVDLAVPLAALMVVKRVE